MTPEPAREVGEASRRIRRGSALWLVAVCSVSACSSEVPLGSWRRADASGGDAGGFTGGEGNIGGSSGSGAESGGGSGGDRLCGVAGQFSSLNEPGTGRNVTVTYTNWTWPAAHDEMEWELEVESEFKTDGYFWAHQFGFVGGPLGFVGLQARGRYRLDPLTSAPEILNMAMFWSSTPPVSTDLSDAPEGNSRAAVDEQTGWWAINLKYPFQACRAYKLKIARDSETTSGVWYVASITDVEANATQVIGRMLVPTSWGRLSTESSMWSNRIGYASLDECSDAEPASARFGFPTADGGTMRPSRQQNVFEKPASCGSSRFAELPASVRHQLAVPSE